MKNDTLGKRFYKQFTKKTDWIFTFPDLYLSFLTVRDLKFFDQHPT